MKFYKNMVKTVPKNKFLSFWFFNSRLVKYNYYNNFFFVYFYYFSGMLPAVVMENGNIQLHW